MNTLRLIALSLILCVICGIGGYYYGKTKAPIKTEIKEVVVEKKDVRTVIKEVSRPDGTKETVTVIEDKSSKEALKDTKVNNKLWMASVLVNPNENRYGIQVTRKVFESVSIGVGLNNSKQVDLVVGFEF